MNLYPYPQAPVVPNNAQVLGDALYKGGELINETFDRQQKLRAAIDAMREQRAKTILAERAAEDKRVQDEFEFKQKKDAADRAAKFREFAAGEEIAPSARSTPTARPALPSQQEMDQLELGSLPAQRVQGDTSWDMLNRATDDTVAALPPVRRERSDEELLRYSLETGTTAEAKQYADARRALRDKPRDAFNDPALLADFQARAQDPAFQQIAEGYASNPQKYGPILQRWGVDNGYAGQRWWAQELSRMYHKPPAAPPATPAFNPQAASQQKFSQEGAIRDDYSKGTAKFEAALPSFVKAQQALQRNNPADAYSAVINFVRTLDPASTVREAEERLARMSASGGILDRWFASINQGITGVLNDEIRKNLYEASKGLLKAEFEAGYLPARDDARSRTLNYPDPTGRAASLDTLNTIGQGRDATYNQAMSLDIMAPPAAAPVRPAASGKPVTPDVARSYLSRAKGDRALARKLLAQDGYTWRD